VSTRSLKPSTRSHRRSGNNFVQRNVFHRRLVCEELEDRRLLSGVTLLTHFFPNPAPDTPTCVSPANGARLANLTPTLQGSAYHDADGESQIAGQWQVFTDAGLNNQVWDNTRTSGDMTSGSIPADVLSNRRPYYWRFRYEDAHGWSTWSDTYSFTTPNLPGDANLDGAVNGADLNAVLSNYNQTFEITGDPFAAWSDGDFNQDGMVNGADLNIVLSHYNQRLPQTYVVNSLGDEIANNGFITLREALQAANLNNSVGDAPAGSAQGTDLIVFAPELFADGANPVPKTITLGGSQLTITDKVIIQGPGKELLAIDANAQSRVFNIAVGAEATLSNVAMSGGLADYGGGIYNAGNLTITSAIVTSNSTIDDSCHDGGGIYNLGTLHVIGSTISNNSAKGNESNGGGIYTEGPMSVTDSTISNNDADGGGGICNYFATSTISNSTITGNRGGFGGGIMNYQSNDNGASILTIVKSSITRNSAARGGGIGNLGTLTVIDTLINGNSAISTYDGGGGGIMCDYGGTLVLVNSTIAGNSSATYAGGVWCANSSHENVPAPFTAVNSIIAMNVSGGLVDYWGVLSADSVANLIGGDSHFVRNPSDGGDGFGDNPITPSIDESANDDYGNLHLRPESVAIDAGVSALANDADGKPLLTDLDGNARIVGASVDIGAYEYQFTQPPTVKIEQAFKRADPTNKATISFSAMKKGIGSKPTCQTPLKNGGTTAGLAINASAGVGRANLLTAVMREMSDNRGRGDDDLGNILPPLLCQFKRNPPESASPGPRRP
jgi:hypothetical protein